MRSLTSVRYPLNVRLRISFLAALLLLSASFAFAQQYDAPKARRHFFSVSYDWTYTEPLHFAEHPVADLVGRPVAGGQLEAFDYRSRDELTLVDVTEFKKRNQGIGVTVFPFGMSVGPALALRGSVEPLPTIRMEMSGPALVQSYALTNARSFDGGVGLYVSDRAPGWGLGSHAFVIGGVGRITSDMGGGSRYFAEGGGGLSSGPIGVELSVKFAWNRFNDPVEHRFLTIPVALRGTLTF